MSDLKEILAKKQAEQASSLPAASVIETGKETKEPESLKEELEHAGTQEEKEDATLIAAESLGSNVMAKHNAALGIVPNQGSSGNVLTSEEVALIANAQGYPAESQSPILHKIKDFVPPKGSYQALRQSVIICADGTKLLPTFGYFVPPFTEEQEDILKNFNKMNRGLVKLVE